MTANAWPVVALSDVMEVKHGFAFPGEGIRDHGPGDILLTPGNFAVGGGFKGEKFKYFDGVVPDDYVLQEGDLIVTMTDLSKEGDTLGYPALVPKSVFGRFLHNQRLGKVSVRNDALVERSFLSYALRTPQYRHEILAGATGSTVKHTSPSRILACKMRLPPPEEQRAIAHILGTLDDKIELNRRSNETLEAMARALFKDWFVDFGPVRAKREGREPYLAPELWSLFPDRFDSSGIPSGWEHGTLDDLLILQRGFDLPTSNRSAGSHPVISASGLHGTHTQAMAEAPGVVTGRSGVLGKVFLMHEDFWPLNTTLWVKEFKRATPHYAFELLQTMDLASFNAGSAVPTLNRNHIHGLPQALPSPNCVTAFETFASGCYRAVRCNDKESETLATLRDTLLPKLLSGELRVREAERHVETAL